MEENSTVDPLEISVSQLVVGRNELDKFVVTAEDGSTQDYQVVIERRVGDANCNSTVSVDGVSVTRNENDEYEYTIAEENETFYFSVVPENSHSKVLYGAGLGTPTNVLVGPNYTHYPQELLDKGSKANLSIKVYAEELSYFD